MLDHSQIVNAWYFTDAELQKAQNVAAAQREKDRIAAQRFKNDCAYFLILFANFKAFLTIKTKKLIDRRQASTSWAGRRGWDVLDSNKAKDINFRSRLSYCLDKTSPEWNKISGYYKIRNDLAHTGTTATSFTIPFVHADLKQIGSQLKT